MRIMQEIEHINSMQPWKKTLVLFLVVACIAAAAYHQYHLDTGMMPDSTQDKAGTVEVAPQTPTTPQAAQPAPQPTQTAPQAAQPAPQAAQTAPQAAQTAPQAAQPAPQEQTAPQAAQTAPQPTQTAPQAAQPAPQATQNAAKFSGVALLGNSRIDGFHIYNSLPGADCLYRVGLNIRTVYTKPMVGEKTPILDKLLEKQYTHIFLTFGDNELGWQYPEIFIEEYQKLIETIQKEQPDAKIYIQSILPVSAEASRKNENNTNNERIRAYNTLLRALAEKMQLPYLDVAAGLQDDKGNLPDDAATDGIHLGETYNKKWADLIAQQITEGVTE